jgi:hypothetical protein
VWDAKDSRWAGVVLAVYITGLYGALLWLERKSNKEKPFDIFRVQNLCVWNGTPHEVKVSGMVLPAHELMIFKTSQRKISIGDKEKEGTSVKHKQVPWYMPD